MKISAIGPDNKCERLRKWHKKFIIFPRYTGNEYQFLCYVMRKYDSSYNYYSFERLGSYIYCDITEYIVQKLKN